MAERYSSRMGNARHLMFVGEVFRYSKLNDPGAPTVDGLRNFLHATALPGQSKVLLEAGINPVKEIRRRGLGRRPVVLIGSSPHKVGSDQTPWEDILEPDLGRVVYLGDNKRPGADPSRASGNRVLLDEFAKHSSPSTQDRLRAAPLVFFSRVAHGGRVKGNVSFQGYGILRTVSLVTQFDPRSQRPFANYQYECAVLSMAAEREGFDWSWVNARRDPSLTDAEVLNLAPLAWRRWVEEGESVVDRVRRRVAQYLVRPKVDQLPSPGSREEQALQEIRDYYTDKKHRFEAVAAEVTGHILSSSGATYRRGWITQASGDGGIDFVGRLDLGSGTSRVKVVVLGQAKCESPSTGTSGRDLARTVARLRRGWIGAYVTTSFFSDRAQVEIVEDQYPLLLVNGLRLSEVVLLMMNRGGFSTVKAFLDKVDGTYETAIERRRPEEILTEHGTGLSLGVSAQSPGTDSVGDPGSDFGPRRVRAE